MNEASGGSGTSGSGNGARPGVVYLVGGGPGDPGLITLRGAELCASADVILYDELVHPALLDLAKEGAEKRWVGKRGSDPGSKQASQLAIEAQLVSLARSGKSVVRLKGGDPFLFGRGSEEAEALVRAEIPFEVVPGIPSPLGASAYAGISVTHRNLASSVTFVSGTTRAGEPFDFREFDGLRGTICVLMGMRRLGEITAHLMNDAGRDPATPSAVIQWGTRAEQRVVEGRLDEIAELAKREGLGSPAIVMVGPVVGMRKTLRWFDNRPLFGKRVLVTRARGQAGETSRRLRLAGAEPIELPLIAIGDPPEKARVVQAVRELGEYDVVVFTSENGVTRFWAALETEERDARALGKARVAAIGSGTAAALRAHGVRADIVPGDFRGEALAQAILEDPEVVTLRARRSPRVLIPRALVAREVLPERLREAGCEVSVVPVYETKKASVERQKELCERLEAGTIDVVMLSSSSMADSLCDLLGPRAAELLARVVVASIGPITTATAEKRGLKVALTAEESTIAGLVAAMERFFKASGQA